MLWVVGGLLGSVRAAEPAVIERGPAEAVSAIGTFSVHFIDVGQGDCTLVKFPNGKRLLIDCGSANVDLDTPALREYLRRNLAPSTAIDLLVITHPGFEHTNRITDVLGPARGKIPVRKVMFTGTPTAYGRAVSAWLDAFKPEDRIVISGQDYNVHPARLLPGFEREGVAILAANVPGPTAAAQSMVLKLSHGPLDVLLAGEATTETEQSILARIPAAELQAEVLRAAAHGTRRASRVMPTSAQAWADAVRPQAVVFSAGLRNAFGRPDRAMAALYLPHVDAAPAHPIRLWEQVHIASERAAVEPFHRKAIFSTATSGTVVIIPDGQSFRLQHETDDLPDEADDSRELDRRYRELTPPGKATPNRNPGFPEFR